MRGYILGNARPVLAGSISCAATSLFGISLVFRKTPLSQSPASLSDRSINTHVLLCSGRPTLASEPVSGPKECDCRLLGVPKVFQVAFRAEAPPSRVSKVRKALRVLFTGPDREKRLSMASALGVYKTPAIAGVLVLTGVLGTCFGPWVLDALGLLGVPKVFQVAFRAEAPPSRVSKVRKALRVLFTGPDREKRLSMASALGVYKTPAIAGVLVLTGVLGTCFGPWVLDALGCGGRYLERVGIDAVSKARDVHRKRPANSSTGLSPSAGDVSTVAMVLTGAAGMVMVNIPWDRSALLLIALGSMVAGAEMPLSP
ncbi:unnamed protein product [Ectocarpus sp. CCAP 1310/34]|nr:unnamed protein product [Ectocarpus sp. CCAP 1310/34]